MQQVQMLSYVLEFNRAPSNVAKAVHQIQQRSEAYCNDLGMSGITLLRGSILFQIIEGAPGIVKTHLKRLRADDTHGPVNVFINEPSEIRHFDIGSMTYFHDSLQDWDLLSTFQQIGEYLGDGLGYSPAGMVQCAWRMVSDLTLFQVPLRAAQAQHA